MGESQRVESMLLLEEIKDLQEMVEEEKRLLEKVKSGKEQLEQDCSATASCTSCNTSVKSTRTTNESIDLPMISIIESSPDLMCGSSRLSVLDEKYGRDELSQSDLSQYWDNQTKSTKYSNKLDETKEYDRGAAEHSYNKGLKKSLKKANGEIEQLRLELAYHKGIKAFPVDSSTSSSEFEENLPRNIEVNSTDDSKYSALENQLAKLERRVDDFSMTSSTRDERLIEHFLHNSDFIQSHIKLKVDIALAEKKEKLAEKKEKSEPKPAPVETYPQSSCSMGRFFRYVVGSSKSNHPTAGDRMS